MINKLEKVSDLKGKEQVIKRELHTLTHKKHQSVGSIDQPQDKITIKSNTHPDPPSQRYDYAHIFAQSASNFIPSKEPE
jgi:hypothetical protein